MKKTVFRRIACVCLCALLGGSMMLPARAAGFRDVPAGYWASGAISRCVSQGWFQGKSAGEFGVGQPMTRGAFAVVVSRFFGWQSGSAYYQIFSDVPQGAWYEPALRACYEHGAVTRQTASFRPGEAITREELAVMLIRALGYGPMAGLAEEDPLPFRDVSTNRGHIAMAYEMGLVNGVGKDLFAPERTATREQAAVMLSRLYEKLHPAAAAETAAIVREAALEADPAGCKTVVVMGKTLLGGQNPRLEGTLSPVQEAITAEKKLLGVSGVSGSWKAPEAAAALLAAEAEQGGYDGLYLDLPQPAGDDGSGLAALAAAVRARMPDGQLYVAADAPVRGQPAPDYTALGQAADCVVLRLADERDFSGAVPVAAMEPLENLYYALRVLRVQIPADRLCLYLTAEGASAAANGTVTAVGGSALRALEERGTPRYSDRYACAYLEDGTSAVWYLNGRAVAARRQMLSCFGVTRVMLSTLSGSLQGGSAD